MTETPRPLPDDAYALEVRGLTGPAVAPVLHDLSLAVRRRSTHVVLGAMHSGKSLLLRLILGLQRSERGTVAIDGASFDAARPNDDELRRLRRRVGVVFESSALVSRLTLLENVELPLAEHTAANSTEARVAATRLLREVGLSDDLDRMPDDASRLDRRRAALARALALRPVLLLVDEPAHGLDAHAAAELDGTLERLRRSYQCSALICSQEVRYAFRAPAAVSVLAGGTIVAQGSLEQLRHSPHEAVRRLVDRRGAA
jgi:ABC-type transporter Mla maintaining outer membrane lipid asymmetry ATPase subunit MlaF